MGKISIIDFYEEIDFEFLSDEVFKQFIENFDINEMTRNLFSKIKKCFSIYKNSDKTENDHHHYKSIGPIYKIVVGGAAGVGKTQIVNQPVNKNFKEDGQPTIGVYFKSYSIQADDKNVELHIWDTAGPERFRSLIKAYFKNALGAVLVFDLAYRQSFEELSMWINDLKSLCDRNAYIVLVGNKKDLEDDRQISESEAQDFAKQHNLLYLETSAKTGSNIENTFVRLSERIQRIKRVI